jgi:hypothetical protein
MEPARAFQLPSAPASLDLLFTAADDLFQAGNQSPTGATKQVTRDYFDTYAVSRIEWERKARAYYDDQVGYFKFLVSEGCMYLTLAQAWVERRL